MNGKYIWKGKLSPSRSACDLEYSATVTSQSLNGMIRPWKAGKAHLKPEGKNPGSSFIHVIVLLLLMTINRGTKGRNVLTHTIVGGAGGALHQLLSSISRESIYC